MKSCVRYLVLLYCLNFIDCLKYRCDYKYSATLKGWFKYHEIPATWYDARLRCYLEGAMLASPTTPNILAYITTRMDQTSNDENTVSDRDIFIGIHATFSKGDYYSVDGIPLAEILHKWAESEPNNAGNEESCLTLNADGLLLDTACNETRPYFCFRSENASQTIGICGTVDPEYQYDNRTKHCYKFHPVPRTFSRANLACSAEGGHLAIINSDEEAKVLSDLFYKYPANKMLGQFWNNKDVAFIGFSEWGERGEWITIHGQTLKEAGYDTFSAGEPSNYLDKETCGSIYRTGRLNDLDCAEHAFICEKIPDYPRICEDDGNAYKNSTYNF